LWDAQSLSANAARVRMFAEKRPKRLGKPLQEKVLENRLQLHP
jgi:hypothetical protein